MKKRFVVMVGILALAAGLFACQKPVEQKTEPKLDYEAETNQLTFSKWGGVYEEAFDLELIAPEGTKIFYTLDGSNPMTSESAMEYTGAIAVKDRSGDANVVSAVDPDLFCTNYYDEGSDGCYIDPPSNKAVDKCTVVRAAQKNADGSWGTSISQTYFIGTMEEHIKGLQAVCEASGTDLSVISISMNSDDLFDYHTGIYVKGAVYAESFKKWDKRGETRKLLANYSSRGREWERTAHVEMYETNPESMKCVISQDCGIRIQGNYSRSDLQKSFRLIAREEYGDKRFHYNIWGSDCKDKDKNTIASFKSIVLRAGGNCAFTSKFNDTYWQDLVGQTNLQVSTKRSRVSVVYLNGEYWGVYVQEEDYSSEYFDDHYGVSDENVVIYKGDAETYSSGYKLDEGTLPEGADDGYFYEELFDAWREYSSLDNDDDYKAFCKLVDEQSFMDYFAIECWINNKWDWPGKNWSMWKSLEVDKKNPYADGRWRMMLYDVEFGGVSGRGDAGVNTIKEDNYNPNGLLALSGTNPAVRTFALLMTNEGFKKQFCKKLEGLSNGAFEQKHAMAELERYEKTYGPLFDQFFNRYPGSGDKGNALNGGYASAQCIRDFLELRQDHIYKQVKWVESR